MQLTSDDTLAEEAEEEDDEKLVWQSRRRSGRCAKAPHVFVIFPDTVITTISTFPKKKKRMYASFPPARAFENRCFPALLLYIE